MTVMVEKISRSEQKRLFKQGEALAAELAELSDNDLKKFPGNDDIKKEIIACRGLKTGAKKRQIKYLANEFLTKKHRFKSSKPEKAHLCRKIRFSMKLKDGVM